jgi:hypothetical protein
MERLLTMMEAEELSYKRKKTKAAGPLEEASWCHGGILRNQELKDCWRRHLLNSRDLLVLPSVRAAGPGIFR